LVWQRNGIRFAVIGIENEAGETYAIFVDIVHHHPDMALWVNRQCTDTGMVAVGGPTLVECRLQEYLC
jgi:hypothetical protein